MHDNTTTNTTAVHIKASIECNVYKNSFYNKPSRTTYTNWVLIVTYKQHTFHGIKSVVIC